MEPPLPAEPNSSDRPPDAPPSPPAAPGPAVSETWRGRVFFAAALLLPSVAALDLWLIRRWCAFYVECDIKLPWPTTWAFWFWPWSHVALAGLGLILTCELAHGARTRRALAGAAAVLLGTLAVLLLLLLAAWLPMNETYFSISEKP